ncbi:MAG: hypothetical protein L0207_07075 [Chlamydiae bacterium]|nr:hypothetical protein [Chlamydiota bacterium]
MKINSLALSCIPIYSAWREWKLWNQLIEVTQNFSPMNPIELSKMRFLQIKYRDMDSSVGIAIQATTAFALFFISFRPFKEKNEEKEEKVAISNPYNYVRLMGIILGLSCLTTAIFHQWIRIKLNHYSQWR